MDWRSGEGTASVAPVDIAHGAHWDCERVGGENWVRGGRRREKTGRGVVYYAKDDEVVGGELEL